MIDTPEEPISYNAYQEMAELYATIVNTKPINAGYERPTSLTLMPEVKGMQVLDAGCGAGFYTNWFVEHGADVVGIDFSGNMIDRCQALLNGKAKFYVADLNQSLSMLEDDSIDLVNASLTIHYLNDLDFVFKEFARILKQQGFFIFSIHHPAATLEWHDIKDYHATQLVTDIWRGMNNVAVSYYHRPLSAYTEALRRAGFVIEQMVEPKPHETMKDVDPEGYENMVTKPTFLFFRTRYYSIEG